MKWISVENKLPDDEDCVLTLSDGYTINWFIDGKFVNDYHNPLCKCYESSLFFTNDEVTHWIKLEDIPEPKPDRKKKK